MRYRFLVLLLFILNQLASQPSALADSFFIAAGGNHDWGPTNGGGFLEGEQHAVGASSTLADAFGSANVSAFAGHGLLAGKINGFVSARGGETRFFNPNVTAVSHGFDVEFLDFDGPEATVQTRAHFNMHGALSMVTTHVGADPYSVDGIGIGRVLFEATVNFTKTSMLLEIRPDDQFTVVKNEFENVIPTYANGQLTFVGGENAQTPLIEVPTNTPVPTIFRLELGFAHLSNGFPGISEFNSDFGSTFSWATTRPVFDLPAGYTVNGFGIVDNQFDIPEPATGALALLSALALAGLMRRRV
jgi:hypothetical protein